MSDWGPAPAAEPVAEVTAEGDAWGAGETGETGDEGADAADYGKRFESLTLSKDEFLQKARSAGWTETTAFNYDDFQRQGGHDADWHGAGKVYEWKDEYGDVGPEVPELEIVLFGGEFLMRQGDHMDSFKNIKAEVHGPESVEHINMVSILLRRIGRCLRIC